jgi:hypothetical protein
LIRLVRAVRWAASESQMETAHSRARRFRLRLYLLALPGCLAVWAWLRFELGWPAPVDALVLVALFAEAALVLGRNPAR